jgi:hypothetical protein
MSQVKVVKKRKTAIVVYQIRKGKYRAFDEAHPDVRVAGKTVVSAIGGLIRLHQEHFGVTIKAAALSEKDGRIEVEASTS